MSALARDYQLLGRLAEGASGEIVLARQRGKDSDRYVVIKRLRARTAADPRAIDGMIREARVLASASHPNICQILEAGVDQGRAYLVLEYLDGLAVNRILRGAEQSGNAIAPRAVGAIAVQVCVGLHHVHRLTDLGGRPLGVIHRDISPHNLLVTTAGAVKIVDFGVARVAQRAATHTGAIRGKVGYMAPEQERGEELDARADLFALGRVMQRCLCGAGMGGAALALVAARACADRPRDRPASAAMLADEIERSLAGEGGIMTPSELAEWLARDLGAELAAWQARVEQAIRARPADR